MKITVRMQAITAVMLAASYSVMAQESVNSDVEEILVTAKQESLKKSLSGKRDADSVIDGISSEELGLFPDDNVADSLAHITGVTVDRTRGGEAQGVSIRGLGPEFSIVTMNDRLMATDAEGREFAFDVLPSEVISEAWVHKSVTAATLEGSIGGAINLVTARPFDNPGLQGAMSVEANYGDKVDDTGYKLTAVASNTFANDTLGVLVSALYSDTPTRTDEMTDLNYGENWDWDHDGDKGYVDWMDSSNLLKIPSTFATTAHLEDRKRTSISTALQFQPNDRVDIVLDGLYTRLDSPSYGYTQSYYLIGRSATWTDATFEGAATPENPDGTIVTGMTMTDLIPELVTITDHRVVDTYQLGLNGSFDVTDNLSLVGDIYLSKATREAGGKDKFVVAHGVGAVPNTATFSLTENGIPNIEFDFDESTGVGSVGDLVRDDQFGPHYSQSNGVNIDDEVNGASLSGRWDMDAGALAIPFVATELSSFDFGIIYNKRTKEREKFDNQQARGLYDGAPFTFGQTGVGVVRPFPVDDFLADIDGEFPRQFVGFDIDAYQEALHAADNNPDIINPDTGMPYPEGYSYQDVPLFNPNESFSVTEETTSAYLQANFSGARWSGNVGLRYVQTDVSSQGWLWEIERVDALSEWDYVVVHKDPVPIEKTNDYDKLLPSFNMSYELTDDLLLRLSYAEVMARASLNQLSTQVNDESASWGEWTINHVGNPELSPVEAEQADISLEWYFKEGSALTAAIFKKNISGFIQDWRERYPDDPESLPVYPREDFNTGEYIDQPFNVFEPKNLDRAKVLGYEFGLQHFFDNGFGVTANYTYIDTESYIDGAKEGVLAGVPDTSYSLTFLYDFEKLSLQVSADHTEGYITSHWSPLNATGETTYKSTADAMTWMSASANYYFSDSLSAYVELNNLLNDNWHGYQGRKDIPGSYSEWGRKLNVGVRYRF
ncbi:TonB-dependent receptor [uncultured Gilvimarinus sp.]|uniref:TonB-dependent receptor n=1 Tax=uncultured Gilvimarinus sp. TaxID=1689143 RepID=UPI0030EF96AC